MKALRLRNAAVITVAALSALFGTILVEAIAVITGGVDAAGMNTGAVSVLLTALSMVFFGIALYVGAIVTANVLSTVLAGRTREIALLRLVGATGGALRRRVVASGFWQGVFGSVIGCVIAVVLTWGALELAFAVGWMDRLEVTLVGPVLVAPLLGVVVSTTLASIVGSRPVLGVSPMQATGSMVESSWTERGKVLRFVMFLVLFVLGAAFFAFGVLLGQESAFGVVSAFVGGVVSSAGVIVGAPVIIPPVLLLFGRAFGRGPVARLASKNAVRHPVRASRATIGLGIGVTLVAMFATVLEQFRALGALLDEAISAEELNQLINAITVILVVLVGFSALLAAVGMVSTLLQSVLQRKRELGLLRTLGFTAAQVRWMIAAEAAQIVATATIIGLVLGSLYGWAGSQSAFGSITGGLLPYTAPVPALIGVVLAAMAIALVSSLVAARAATRATPIEALTALT
jgi:putative ABC transport system permease protein